MIQCVIFDADGTLINSLGVWRDADEEYLSARGRTLTDDVYEAVGKMTFCQSIAYVKRYYGIDDTEEKISDDVIRIVRKKYATEVKTVPGIKPLLQRLYKRGVVMAVATANCAELVSPALVRNNIDGYFAGIFTCDGLKQGKNDAGIYLSVSKKLGFLPGDTAVIEDEQAYVNVARTAGFTAFHISDVYNIEKI